MDYPQLINTAQHRGTEATRDDVINAGAVGVSTGQGEVDGVVADTTHRGGACELDHLAAELLPCVAVY